MLFKHVGHYSFSNYVLEQRAEPACDAAIWYLLLGNSSVVPEYFLLDIPFRTQKGALSPTKGRLYNDDDGTLLLMRVPTPPVPTFPGNSGGNADRHLDDELTRACVPLFMRLWIVHSCHANAPCSFGVVLTRYILERICWWIDMHTCTRCWFGRCLQCQAREASQQTVR